MNELMRPSATGLNPYEEVGTSANTSGIVGHLLTFGKMGPFRFGQDKDELAEGTRMLVYMPSFSWGWIKWQDKQVIKQLMPLVSEQPRPPARETLGDLDDKLWAKWPDGRPKDPWQETMRVVMCDVHGQVYTFSTPSKGGHGALKKLSAAYGQHVRQKPEEIPVVELYIREYMHPQWNETCAPKFQIIGWTQVPKTFTDVQLALGEEDATETLALEDLMGHDEIELQAEPEPEPAPPPPPAPAAKRPVGRPPLKPPAAKGTERRSVRF